MLRIAPGNQPQPELPPELSAPPEAAPPDISQEQPPDIAPDKPKRFDVEKLDQVISGYMGPELGPFMCSRCDFFEEPNACHIVQGAIAPDGCCNLFTPMDSGDQAKDMEEAPEEESPTEPEEQPSEVDNE